MRFFTKSRRDPVVKTTHGPAEVVQLAPIDTRPKTKATTEATVTASIPNWPHEARTLKKHTWTTYVYMLGDAILVLLPVYFILLGVAVITLNGKPTKDNAFGKKVEAAIQLGPTLFPIVFAAICGRSMKMIARYVAERRAKLATLELLMASQSVWGTIESQFLMQRLTLVGANLLFLWTLSPLGGQASLRLMSRGETTIKDSAHLRYMSSGPGSVLWGLTTQYQANGKFADASSLYTTALMAPISNKLSPRDPWGNVRIPRIELYNGSAPGSWHDVPANITSAETYSSLVGLPIVGLPSRSNSSFTIENTYLTVDCKPFETAYKPPITNIDDDWDLIEEMVPGHIWINKSQIDNNPFGFTDLRILNGMTSFFMDTDRPNYNGYAEDTAESAAYSQRLDASLGNTNVSLLMNGNSSLREPRNLLYASKYPNPGKDGAYDESVYDLSVARCALTQTHVEVLIHCTADLCAAKKVRKSLTDTRTPEYTGLEHIAMMREFVQRFPFAVPPGLVSSSATERFLYNSSDYLFLRDNRHSAVSPKDSFVDLRKVPIEDFSRRLSLLLSTFYQLTLQPSGYWGSLPNNLSLYGPDTLPVSDINYYLPNNMTIDKFSMADFWIEMSQNFEKINAPFIGASTKADLTTAHQVFVCQVPWVVLLFTCCATLLLTGAVAMVLKGRTLSPELFGFVTSMTYENPHVRIPNGGSTLDAMERAKLLKDVEVCVGDVHGEQTTGHIALSSGVPVRKLERGRLYA